MTWHKEKMSLWVSNQGRLMPSDPSHSDYVAWLNNHPMDGLNWTCNLHGKELEHINVTKGKTAGTLLSRIYRLWLMMKLRIQQNVSSYSFPGWNVYYRHMGSLFHLHLQRYYAFILKEKRMLYGNDMISYLLQAEVNLHINVCILQTDPLPESVQKKYLLLQTSSNDKINQIR